MDEFEKSRILSSIIGILFAISFMFITTNLILPMFKEDFNTSMEMIETNEIETNEIENNEIETNKIETNKIETNKIENNEIENNEIETNKIETNEIETNKIENNEIETNKIETNEIENNENMESLEITSSINEITIKMIDMIKNMSIFMIPLMILPLLINILRLVLGNYSISSSFSSYTIEEFDSFSKQLEKQKELMINDKLINQAILNSNKKLEITDLDFLRNCIEQKTEWFSYKKQIIEVDPDKKLFSVMIIDILNNLPTIMDYFKKDENKCEDIQEVYKYISFKKYISNERNYFEIKGRYYLKEVVFYILTNNIIKVKELYRYLNRESERLNLSHSIANFIERELSLNDDLSTTNTLEEVVGKFNGEHQLSINVGFAKNLIYLSRIDNSKKLEKYLIRETSLMDEMKSYRSSYVEDLNL